jgi:hypothetical protein
MPLDFINENLNPSEIRDERNIDVTLTPQENVPTEKLMERANNMRSGARLGLVTPLPEVKPNAVLPKIGLPGEGLPGGQPIPYQSLPAAPAGTYIPAPPPGTLGPPPGTLGPPPGTLGTPPGRLGPPPGGFMPPLP